MRNEKQGTVGTFESVRLLESYIDTFILLLNPPALLDLEASQIIHQVKCLQQ